MIITDNEYKAVKEFMNRSKSSRLPKGIIINEVAKSFNMSPSNLAIALNKMKNRKKYNNPNQLNLFKKGE